VAGALALLELCAFLAADAIPRDLLAQPLDPPIADAGLASLAANPFALDQAVAALRRYGLVKATEQTLAVHRLLQQVVRASLAPQLAASRAGLAVRLLDAAFPTKGYWKVDVWPVCEQLLPHALVAAGHAQQHTTEPAATVRLLDSAADYLQGRGRYREARELRARAMALAEATFGPDHPTTARTLSNLATVLRDQGDLDQARTLHERALAVLEAQLGRDHLATAQTLNGLGWVLYRQGDLAGAREHLERALAIRQATLGPDHPEVATALHNLGRVLADQGDLVGARHHYEQALAISQAALGADHPLTHATADALVDLQR
jgi:tetratricopeptide (TPR) repeat protein